MKVKRSAFTVICSTCKAVVGVINEIEDTDRPGIFQNEPEGEMPPTCCPQCNGQLMRA